MSRSQAKSDPSSNLAHATAEGAKFATGAQVGKTLIQFGSAPLLGRLLTPNDFGVVAIVLAILGFVSAFRDLGLVQAAIRAPALNHLQGSTLFWLNGLAALVGSAIIAGLATPLAEIYDDPRLASLMLAAAPMLVVGGLSGQATVILYRRFRYTTIAVRDLTAAFVGAVTAVIVAMADGGAWALIAQHWCMVVVTLVWSWVAARWCPALPRGGTGIRDIVKHGLWLSASEFMAIGQRSLQRLLLGNIVGTTALGHFDRAMVYAQLPLTNLFTPISKIALSSLSRVQQDGQRFERSVIKLTGLIAVASAPIAAVAFVVGPDGLVILLGSQWHEAGLVLRIVSPAILLSAPLIVMGLLFVVYARGRDQLLLTTITLTIETAALAWGAWVGGITGAAAALMISGALLVIPSLLFATSGTPVTLKVIAMETGRPIAAGLIGCLGGAMGVSALADYSLFVRFLWGLLIAGGLPIIIMVADPSMRRLLFGLIAILRTPR